ncbi:MAG: ArsR/SmtB family transcription factor [Candidatus Saccharibacteria bacterium]
MDNSQLTRIMKALSNENRLELYLEIAKRSEVDFSTEEECFISDIMCCLNIGAPTISHHLKELVNAGLIITEKRGKYLVARVNTETIDAVNKVLGLRLKPEK